MRSHEADALNPVHFIHLAQQFGKAHRMLQTTAIGIDILPKEHDFLYAVCRHLSDFRQDILRPAAALTPAHIRHDAVAAEIVAAKHDVDPGFERVFAPVWQFLHDAVRVLPDVDDHAGLGSALLLHHRQVQKLRKFIDIVRPENQVHKREALLDSFHCLRFLHHAAAECDKHIRMLPPVGHDLSQMPVNLVVGIFAHGAGIV